MISFSPPHRQKPSRQAFRPPKRAMPIWIQICSRQGFPCFSCMFQIGQLETISMQCWAPAVQERWGRPHINYWSVKPPNPGSARLIRKLKQSHLSRRPRDFSRNLLVARVLGVLNLILYAIFQKLPKDLPHFGFSKKNCKLLSNINQGLKASPRPRTGRPELAVMNWLGARLAKSALVQIMKLTIRLNHNTILVMVVGVCISEHDYSPLKSLG